MKTFPLQSISVEEAKNKQFKLVDLICQEFKGSESLNLGDLGVVQPGNKPLTTKKVEKVIARFFESSSCILVTGAGTGALRFGILSMFSSQDSILVHKAPIYPTTKITIESLNLNIIEADFNSIDDIKEKLNNNDIKGVLIQTTRQKPDDEYDLGEIIRTIKELSDCPIITDDNYAAMKISKIGVELGANLSTFSSFKLLGPEGVGIIVGDYDYINKIEKMNYSGGSKVQGWQAMEVLRGLVYAPVSLAIQAEENNRLLEKLNNKEINHVKNAFLANSQSKVLLVEFDMPIAREVLREAELLGAAPNPVGAESKYEMVPMFYRVSGTFIESDPTLQERMIRINPMRSGNETIMRILKESIEKVTSCF
ncbi:MAG: aminotransferase class V-fold PLP-dependent enzyme [Erysipelotrichaceae bacterium]